MKLLDPPEAIQVFGNNDLPDAISVTTMPDFTHLSVQSWIGPEVLSGHWWSEPYRRDYYWAISANQLVLWLFKDQETERWFLHGWLD
jgi:hypothetical protein